MYEQGVGGEQVGLARIDDGSARAESSVREERPRGHGPVPEHGIVWSPTVPNRLLARYYLPRSHSILQGNSCQLLRDGVEAYPAMLEAIRGARRYIRLETYMFITDAVGE